MDAAKVLEDLLKTSGAEILRNNGHHVVYKLPNGEQFSKCGTPSDHRSPENDLHNLRRKLGISKQGEVKPMEKPMEPRTPAIAPIASVIQNAPTASEPISEQPLTVKDRALAGKSREKELQEKLTIRLLASEQREKMYDWIIENVEIADGNMVKQVMLSVLYNQEKKAEPPPPPAPRPIMEAQPIKANIQVTRNLVLLAINALVNEGLSSFTVNDVRDRMVGNKVIENMRERMRVRTSIAQAMLTLFDRGFLVKKMQGSGKHETIWELAPQNANAPEMSVSVGASGD